MSETKKLTATQIFLLGGALFSLHFGSGSMIWPMHWGRNLGSSLPIGFIGVFISSLLLEMAFFFI